jgi:hypothetical protein
MRWKRAGEKRAGEKGRTFEGFVVRQVEERLHEVVNAMLVKIGDELFRDGSVLGGSSRVGLYVTNGKQGIFF